jgi:surface polysaccharide O-acyltransferase-like enzyme
VNFPPAKHRQAAVELARGVAAYGVIVVHVGLISRTQATPSVDFLQKFFEATCVPFFLAASFYFAALTGSKAETLPVWLKRRASRLLVPYFLWSVIYTILQVVEVFLRPDPSAGLIKLFSDPMGRLLFGSSGVALYFLPLLFVGLAAMRLMSMLFANHSLIVLGIGLAVALSISIPLDFTNNGFELDTGTAFEPVLTGWLGTAQGHFWATFLPTRFVLVVVALILRCLPYMFLAWICARVKAWPVIPLSTRLIVGALSLGLIVATTLGWFLLPESLIGYAFLLVALEIPSSNRMRWAELLGLYSFGIYLVHQVILEGVKLAVRNHPVPMNLGPVLTVTMGSFAVAFLLVYLADRFGGKWGRLLMALPEPAPVRSPR